MPAGYIFWGAWLLSGIAYEVWAVWVRHGPLDTLSEFTGWVLRTNTALGATLLTLLMAGLALWYPRHVSDLSRRNTRIPDTSKEN